MSRSRTTTAMTTTVASQRFLTTPEWQEGISALKQLTLRLDPSPQQLLSQHNSNMAQTTRRRTPISRLPVELLSYIFLLGAHTPDLTDGDGRMCTEDREDEISPCLTSSSTTPDVLAAVNRHWRNVAFNTPRLWTRICVTIGDIMYHREGPMFDIVSRYLARSANCPLDILIDARDPDWDWSEVDTCGARVSPYVDELHDYTHPFKIEHMHHVLSILLPHVQRFRSLAILTDRWAPMQTALDCLSMEIPSFVSTPRPLPSSLPLLETLVLMRCNEFASYYSEFSPADRKDPARLPFSALLRASEDSRKDEPEPILPRLKKLTLSGVHTQWSALPRLLPAPHSPYTSGLETLELSYHCNEVRPSERDFKSLLQRCPQLKDLTIRSSGPKSPNSPHGSRCSTTREDPVPLFHLDRIVVGYDDSYTAATIIDMMDARAVRHLVLEDASSPAREERVDAEPLLQACTTLSRSRPRSHSQALDSHANAGDANFKEEPFPFPRVETLSLSKVDASAEAFEALYEALPNLRALTVLQMFLLGGGALSPDVRLAFQPPFPLSPSYSYSSLSGAEAEGGRNRVVESIIEAGGEHIADKLATAWETRDSEAAGSSPTPMKSGTRSGQHLNPTESVRRVVW